MIELGLYDIALLPGVEEHALVEKLAGLGDGMGVVQLTRVTVGFEARTLRRAGSPTTYTWMLTATLMSAAGYEFAQNIERLQAAINDVGVVVGVHHFFALDAGVPAGSS